MTTHLQFPSDPAQANQNARNSHIRPSPADTGAYKYKPLFIAAGTTTVVLLDLSLIAERWLRHNGRLAPNTSTFQKVLSVLAILASIAGAVGLILLSIFDTYRHPTMHDRCLVVFM